MIHEELLHIIKQDVISFPMYRMSDALRAVLELHQPQSIELLSGEVIDTYCLECDDFDYPCATIQAIEKELK